MATGHAPFYLTWMALVVAFFSLACSDDNGADSTATRVPSSTASVTAETSATPAPVATETPLNPNPTQSPEPPDLDGNPFSTRDVRQAIEKDSDGYSFRYVEREPLCPQTSVPELPVWSANLAGSDFGPVLVLWLYPSEAALRQEWDVSGEHPRPLLDGCELPTEFTYWNGNAILAFEVWLGLGEEFSADEHDESPDDHPAVRAFLYDLTP